MGTPQATSDPFAAIAQPVQSAQGDDPFAAIAQSIGNSGELTNDVGNKVIMPKDGESFADTMKRAAAYGKTVTPEQINKEMATAPRKAGQVSLAALAGGAAFPAAVAGGEAAAPFVPPAAKAVASWTAAHPVATAFAYHIARELGIPLPKILYVMGKFQGQ